MSANPLTEPLRLPWTQNARRRWLVPSLSDCLIGALGAWLLAYTLGGSAGLLQDINTGLHIRTGEYILDHGAVPEKDLFSFSKPGGDWFAWEWLADVAFALAWRWSGLNGVVMLTLAAIGVSAWVSVRHMLDRGANALVAIGLLHLGIGVSSVHYLARPHVFTLAFTALAWYWIDRDRRNPGRLVWLLIPLTALWANLHGGFAGFVMTLGLVSAGSAIERNWEAARRYGALALLCGVAALANPHGFGLYFHMAEFLRAGWVRELVQDFQPPRFQGEGGMYLELALFGAVIAAALLAMRRQFASALVVIAWAHASLLSVRHFGILFLIAAPLAGGEIARLVSRIRESQPAGSILGTLCRLGEDHTPALSRASLWLPALWLLAALWGAGAGVPDGFPTARVPAELIERHVETLAAGRLFTLDSWADYLVFRSYPRQRVFFDGRADYYGPEIARHYTELLNGHSGWDEALARYGFNMLLIPHSSPLAGLVARQPGWKLVDQDRGVDLYRRIAQVSGLPG